MTPVAEIADTTKQTVAMDEEAHHHPLQRQQQQPSEQPSSPASSVSPPSSPNRTLLIALVCLASAVCFAAGLVTGAFTDIGNDDNNNNVMKQYQPVGQVLSALDDDDDSLPRNVFSITPLAVQDNMMVLGDPVYAHPNDPEPGLGESTEDRRGRVRVFRLVNNRWTLQGQVLYGEIAISTFGYAVDLSPDGQVLAVGSRHSGNSSSSADADGNNKVRRGAVHVYDWKEQLQQWVLRGAGPVTDDSQLTNYAACGNSISLSANGNQVAYTCSGEVRLSQWNAATNAAGGSWKQQDVIVKRESGGVGPTLQLAADGKSILVGYDFTDARILDKVDNNNNNNNNTWAIRGSLSNDDKLAQVLAADDDSVQWPPLYKNNGAFAMSADGTVLAVLYVDNNNQFVIRTFVFNGRTWIRFGANDMVIPTSKSPAVGGFYSKLVLSHDGRKLFCGLAAGGADDPSTVIGYEYNRQGVWEESVGTPLLDDRVITGAVDLDLSSTGTTVAVSNQDGTRFQNFVVRAYQEK